MVVTVTRLMFIFVLQSHQTLCAYYKSENYKCSARLYYKVQFDNFERLKNGMRLLQRIQ